MLTSIWQNLVWLNVTLLSITVYQWAQFHYISLRHSLSVRDSLTHRTPKTPSEKWFHRLFYSLFVLLLLGSSSFRLSVSPQTSCRVLINSTNAAAKRSCRGVLEMASLISYMRLGLTDGRWKDCLCRCTHPMELGLGWIAWGRRQTRGCRKTVAIVPSRTCWSWKSLRLLPSTR